MKYILAVILWLVVSSANGASCYQVSKFTNQVVSRHTDYKPINLDILVIPQIQTLRFDGKNSTVTDHANNVQQCVQIGDLTLICLSGNKSQTHVAIQIWTIDLVYGIATWIGNAAGSDTASPGSWMAVGQLDKKC